MRIDAHLHFWSPASGFDNRPIADNAAYRRDFLPEHVRPDLDACGIDGVVLVQTCPQAEETEWLLRLETNEPRVLGVTAWIDLDRPGHDLMALATDRRIVGIRAQLRRIEDPDFIRRPHVITNLAGALRAGLNVTILAEPRHYVAVSAVLNTLPDGPITLNHLGLPFPDVDREAWRAFMGTFAARPNGFVQLSGLPFLYGEGWRAPAVLRLMDEALDLLGPERLMFASDWPMLLRFATYSEWMDTVLEFLERRDLPQADREAILAGNACRANPRLEAALPTTVCEGEPR